MERSRLFRALTPLLVAALLGGCNGLNGLSFRDTSGGDTKTPDTTTPAATTDQTATTTAPAVSPTASQDSAIADLDKTVAQKTSDLAEVFAERAAAKQLKPDVPGAIADLDSYLAFEPRVALAYLDRGLLKLQQHDIEGAVADYSHAIDLQSGTAPDQTPGADPLHHLLAALFPGTTPNDQANAWYLRGAARQAKGDMDGALGDFNQAITLAPDFGPAYNNRGIVKGLAQADANGAVTDFDKAISLQPNSADAYANRGNIKTALNDFKGAMDDFNKAIELNGNWPEAYFDRAFARQQNNDLDGAVADLNKAIELKPDYSDAYFNRGLDHDRRGELDDAIADYDRVIVLNPGSADAYANRGIDKYRKNDIDSSIADFSKAIQFKRNMVNAYIDRAVASKIKGDVAGAVADYDQVIKLSDRDTGMYPRLYRCLFLLQLQRGDPRKDLADAIASWPEGWPKVIGSYLTGGLNETQFLARAEGGDPRTVAVQRCEAFYFVGVVHLIAGDSAAARSFFGECAATDRPDRFSFKFAQAESARLAPSP